MATTFSIVIPNLHSPIIDRVITAIRQQDHRLDDAEVLVVGMDRYGLVPEDDLVRFIRTERPTPPARARNIGWQAARGEIICFLDADCLVAANWLSEIEAVFADNTKGAVSGTFDFPRDGYWTVADTLAHYSAILGAEPVRLIEAPSMNLAVRRSVLTQVGGFDERFPFPAGEDSEFTRRLRRSGHDIWLMPTITLYHEIVRGSLRRLWRHSFRFGRYAIWTLPESTLMDERPGYLSHWLPALLTCVLAPGYVATRVFWRNRALWKYWYTYPAVWLAKFAWQLGVSWSLWKPMIVKSKY